MSNTEFGVSISDELVEELDELTEQCVDLQASRSEVVEAILTAYFQGDCDRPYENTSQALCPDRPSTSP
jgi:metal-responsive CopG/Arc/MetJ family transcriptional regulator